MKKVFVTEMNRERQRSSAFRQNYLVSEYFFPGLVFHMPPNMLKFPHYLKTRRENLSHISNVCVSAPGPEP